MIYHGSMLTKKKPQNNNASDDDSFSGLSWGGDEQGSKKAWSWRINKKSGDLLLFFKIILEIFNWNIEIKKKIQIEFLFLSFSVVMATDFSAHVGVKLFYYLFWVYNNVRSAWFRSFFWFLDRLTRTRLASNWRPGEPETEVEITGRPRKYCWMNSEEAEATEQQKAGTSPD